MFESCLEIREHFSDYADGLCSPGTLRSVRYHLRYCSACQREMKRNEILRESLRSLPRRTLRANADLRLRVRVSQELHRNLVSRILVRLENGLRGLLLPATGGLATAILCFCLIMGSETVRVSNLPDTQLSFVTPAQVLALAPLDFDTGCKPVVVVTYIDAEGQVKSYKVLSGQHSPELMRHLDRLIYFSRFAPAMAFGKPTAGRVVLALRQINVRG
ncbi:MAG TPA: zf-HC2 domain-containing protein [Terriglobia bacterium]|nr:zf-HC2 domain-containing protein [Terriglobia bacterium]